jgi:hypothetical protein
MNKSRYSNSSLVALGCMLMLFGVEMGQAWGQDQYVGDGDPTGLEEEIRWMLNRGRYDRNRENAVRRTRFTDVPQRTGPLAPNAAMTRAARNHADDMARLNHFNHRTVPGSAHYNASIHPQAWHRMEVEGYDWDLAGENLAAGQRSATEVYVALWKSGGHRRNMYYRYFTEIGLGYARRNSSTYVEYYAMNLGRSWDERFFTGTLFADKNGNGRYTRDEAVSGVRVSLVVDGRFHEDWDSSSEVGSFAVPLREIAPGSEVRVLLINDNQH